MNDDRIVEPCKNCEHRTKIKGFYVCGCQCGRATLNSGHPLAPCCLDNGTCIRGLVDENGQDIPDEAIGFIEDYRRCYIDEDAIMEGNRCYLYIWWLGAMRKFNGPDYKWPTGFDNPIIPHD